MSRSINYSDFVDLFLDSSEDYEPYGCITSSSQIGDETVYRETSTMLHRDSTLDEPWSR